MFLEVVLRVFDYGLSGDIFRPSRADTRYLEINPELGSRYFPRSKFQPHTARDFIAVQKPSNTFRIFVLGGSSAAGYPYFFNGSFSTMLRVLLEHSYPERRFEMMNLAMTAVNSYTLMDLMDQLLNYQPDLILVYAGHNEFYGALGVGSVETIGGSRFLIRTYLKLTRLRLFQLVHDFTNWFMSQLQTLGGEAKEETATLMERMAGKKQIGYKEPLYRKALKIYRENLKEIVQKARKHHIPIILSTLSSNVHHQKPFVDKFSENADKSAWNEHFRLARTRFDEGELTESARHLQQCLELDSLPASPYFILAKLQEMMNDSLRSYSNYYRAKDYDALRFRASEDFNTEIRQICSDFRIPLVDLKQTFEEASPFNLPGNELFLEHLHPNLQGYFLMAKAFHKQITESNLIPGKATPLPPDNQIWPRLGLTEFDEEVGKIRILILTSGWPFKKDRVGSIENITYTPRNLMQELALKYWQKKVTWEKAHVQLAEHYTQTGQYDLAEKEYRALMVGTPINPSPFHRLAHLLISQSKFEEALPVLHRLIELEENYFGYKMLGALYITLGDMKRSIPYLEKAYRMDQNDPENLFFLAGAYLQTGKISAAKKIADHLKKVDPNFPGLPKIWKRMKELSSKE
ncbi:MAG: hypothetical protein Kow0042_02610 [Calditrichia bacterium]